ncbi:aBC transporter ATP-binding protein [Clostridium sp. CAG:1219]|nr:aBC transporter ATP-binding protein [Clostridium sp. CAG:1219]
MGELEKDKGKITFGSTIKKGYVPNDNTKYFESDKSITKWLGDETGIEDETILRSFLGRMLFSGDEALKSVNVLSGGEKARCMMSRVMLQDPNLIFLDEPTNHLDLESITSLNNGLIRSTAEIIFVSHDHQFTQTVANRIIEITENGVIDKRMTYDEYLEQNHDKMKKEINF